MADLITITYETEATAEAVQKKVLEMQSEYLISLEDAVVVVKDQDRKIKLNQMINATAAVGFWGFLVGLLFFMPLAGVLVDAASGALAGKLSDYGIKDDVMKSVAVSIKPDGAALFPLVRKMTADKVVAGLQQFGGTVLRSSLDESKQKDLREALSEQIKSAPPAAWMTSRYHREK